MIRQTVPTQTQRELKEVVKEYLEVDVELPNRRLKSVYARMVYYKILRELGYSWQSIGDTLNKHHATVLHAVNSFDDLSTYDKDLVRSYDIVKDIFLDGYHEKVHPLHYVPREELIAVTQSLEKRNKTLTLSNESLNNRLNFYKKYDTILEILSSRNKVLTEEHIEKIKIKLTHILNGL